MGTILPGLPRVHLSHSTANRQPPFISYPPTGGFLFGSNRIGSRPPEVLIPAGLLTERRSPSVPKETCGSSTSLQESWNGSFIRKVSMPGPSAGLRMGNTYPRTSRIMPKGRPMYGCCPLVEESLSFSRTFPAGSGIPSSRQAVL